MAESFLAEIKMFGCNFPPRGYAFCNGQLLAISQNTALFSLLGTNYGGNGTSTFGLPNLQGCSSIGAGQGPGLSQYYVGQTGGSANVTLNINQLGSHNHVPLAATVPSSANPSGLTWSSASGKPAPLSFANAIGVAPGQVMSASATSPTGGTQPHNNLMPYLAVNFCIALTGIFPSRN